MNNNSNNDNTHRPKPAKGPQFQYVDNIFSKA